MRGFPKLTRNLRSQQEPKLWSIQALLPQTLWIWAFPPKPVLLWCPILAKFLRGKGGSLGWGRGAGLRHTGKDPGRGGTGSGEGAGGRQPEAKARLAGAGDWQLAMTLGMFSRWSRGIKLVPASRAEANLGSGAIDQAVPTVHCVLPQ